jgi:acyl dehydratase
MTSNPDRFLEDVAVGDVLTAGPIEISEAEIIAFARAYDPQPFHTDPGAAAKSPFGGLIASGWHVAGVVMRTYVNLHPFGSTPVVGMGIDELRWLQPVRPGDRLDIRWEVIEVKRSASRPDRGMVRTHTTVVNQAGVKVLTYTSLAQMPARAPAS